MGKFLFKYRSFLPIPYFLFLLVFIKFNRFNFLLGGVFVIMGLAIRYFSQGFAGDWMRGNEVEADYLLDKGFYSIMRHPLYSGNFLIGFGFTLAAGFFLIYLLPFYLVVFTIYYFLIIKEEENYLDKKFGDSFIRYRKNTPAFFPRFRKWKGGKFSSKNAFRKEISTYLTVGFIFLLFLVRVFVFD